MDPQKVKAVPNRNRMSVHLTIRVSPDIKGWLVKHNYSPTAIFHEAIKELGYNATGVEEWIVDDSGVPESGDVPQGKAVSHDNQHSEYFKTVRVKTRHGWKVVRIKQYKSKRR